MENKKNNKNEGIKFFLGMPMRWNKEKMFKNLWNSHENKLFLPKYFGIGWDFNFHALFTRLGLVKKNNRKDRIE